MSAARHHDDLSDQLQRMLRSQSSAHTKCWIVAYSGGLDSSVLLHLLTQINQRAENPKTMVALHINHQLSTQASSWAQHCLGESQKMGVTLVVRNVEVDTSGQSLEAAARAARYRVFERFVEKDDLLFMAHHLNDQAETLLLRLLRGAGVHGLSAIPSGRDIGKGQLIRPLLAVSRDELMAYAKDHQLRWVEDDSNEDVNIDRNYLRHEILPRVRARWSGTVTTLARTADLMKDAQRCLIDLAQQDLSLLDLKNERWCQSVSWLSLMKMHRARRNNVLRYWCQQQNWPVPEVDQLKQIDHQFFQVNAASAQAVVSWRDMEIRQFNYRIFLMKNLQDFTALDTITWNIQKDSCLALISGDFLQRHDAVGSEENHGMLLSSEIANNLTVAWRRGGERCTPYARQHSQTLKKLLQECQLETWLRGRVPLIYKAGQLVAVGDLWICKNYVAGVGESGFKFTWQVSGSTVA
ncbi:MAG: tRNA(Ile)-lysidine synthase [Cellvibrionaceae bacterium]|jgi:tRNA(Ile)-lysidine synthase